MKVEPAKESGQMEYYFINLDFSVTRGPIFLSKSYLFGAQVVWGRQNFTRRNDAKVPSLGEESSINVTKFICWGGWLVQHYSEVLQ